MPSYPERLLPGPDYHHIDFSKITSRSYFLIRHTDSQQITNEEGRLKVDYIAFQTDHLRDYSTNLLGEFEPNDVGWTWLKGTICTELWNKGEDGILPVLGKDVDWISDRGRFYIPIYLFHNKSFPSPNSNDDASIVTCQVIHTPTKGNFWHCSLRWWHNDDDKDVSTWGGDKQAIKRRRQILSSARTFIIENALIDEPAYQAIPPEAYRN